jgi:hypothetical protein
LEESIFFCSIFPRRSELTSFSFEKWFVCSEISSYSVLIRTKKRFKVLCNIFLLFIFITSKNVEVEFFPDPSSFQFEEDVEIIMTF